MQSYLDDTEPKGNHYYWKTEYLAELSDGLLSTAAGAVRRRAPIPEAELGFLHLGGALNERPEDDGAVGNRDARYVIGVQRHVGRRTSPRPTPSASGSGHAWERSRPFSTGGNYINFQTADEGDDRVRATYGANYDRLAQVKRALRPGQPVPGEPQHAALSAAAQARSRAGSAWTGSPSTRVARTRTPPRGPVAASNGSRSSTARSASLPGAMEPVWSSRRRA